MRWASFSVAAAGVGHAFDDVAPIRTREARHVHLDPFGQAHATGSLVGSVGIRYGLSKPARSKLEAPAADLVDRGRR